jgi:hypothetical protein
MWRLARYRLVKQHGEMLGTVAGYSLNADRLSSVKANKIFEVFHSYVHSVLDTCLEHKYSPP